VGELFRESLGDNDSARKDAQSACEKWNCTVHEMFVAMDKAEQERQARESACSHVYVGKQFHKRVAITGIDGTFEVKYEVIGFSRESQRVTVRGIDGTSEVSCSWVE
jgi:hypothetical protein